MEVNKEASGIDMDDNNVINDYEMNNTDNIRSFGSYSKDDACNIDEGIDIEQNEDKQDDSGNENFQPNVKIPVGVIALLIAVIILDVICMMRFPKILHEYKMYETAQELINKGETEQTINTLLQMTKKHPNSLPMALKTMELSMEEGYYDTALYVLNHNLVGKELSTSEYFKIDNYSKRLTKIYASYKEVDKILKTISAEDLKSGNYKVQKKRLDKLLDDGELDRAYIYYSLGNLEVDLNTAKGYMKKCYDIDPEFMDVRVQLGLMYRRLGDFMKANRYTGEALVKEKSDSNALRSRSIIKMLEGDLKGGLTDSRAAYHSNPDGIYIRETYLIALTLNGNSKEIEKINNEMSEAGEKLESDTMKLLEGKITLIDYYVGKEGE